MFRYLRDLEKEGFLDLREHNKFRLKFQENYFSHSTVHYTKKIAN